MYCTVNHEMPPLAYDKHSFVFKFSLTDLPAADKVENTTLNKHQGRNDQKTRVFRWMENLWAHNHLIWGGRLLERALGLPPAPTRNIAVTIQPLSVTPAMSAIARYSPAMIC